MFSSPAAFKESSALVGSDFPKEKKECIGFTFRSKKIPYFLFQIANLAPPRISLSPSQASKNDWRCGMRFDLSKRELRLVEFAIVRTDEFWAPQGDGGWKLEDQTARRVLDKIRDAYERGDRGKARGR